ncbi:hypothetical protein BGW38_005536 [Lunasporangiospora selenospora]|uniref:2,3-diketo-5-methylthio-1-phosphopentane phosphatase n=1 Tax=Lunasporangiospora selenospora TaxID=979761 RepID=A0A9P6FMW5_9FUNG|nr:hypothetical protein BGW38_005536 [Lunasporangiospora selenospora]
MDYWWSNVKLTFDEGKELLKEVPIDTGFLEFYSYAKSNDIPFSIVSCGLDIIIREYLSWYLGQDEAEKLTVLANHGQVIDRQWKVTYYDNSPHSHDKSTCIKESKEAFKRHLVQDQIEKIHEHETELQRREQHVIVFCGDGISDLSAAREADVLFARRGRDLEKYCRTHKIPFLPFDTFDQVRELIQGLKNKTLTLEEINKRQQSNAETDTIAL